MTHIPSYVIVGTDSDKPKAVQSWNEWGGGDVHFQHGVNFLTVAQAKEQNINLEVEEDDMLSDVFLEDSAKTLLKNQ